MSDTADEALAKALYDAWLKPLMTHRGLVAAVRAAGWAPKAETLTEVEKALREFARDEARAGAHFVGVNDAADLVASLREKP